MRIVKNFTLVLAFMLTFYAIPGLADPPVQTEGITVPVIDTINSLEIPDNDAMVLMRDMK